MPQNILVAFDDSENALRCVEFVAQTFTLDNSVTLFAVLPDTSALCDMNSPELTPYFVSQQSTFCTLEDKKKNLLEEALERAKGLLLTAGFDKANIHIKLMPKKKGIARDIADEAQTGYDLIVLGRRGTSGIKDFLLGGISPEGAPSCQGVIHRIRQLRRGFTDDDLLSDSVSAGNRIRCFFKLDLFF